MMTERDGREPTGSGEGPPPVVHLVSLPAELTTENFPAFQRELARRLEAPGARIVLDLSVVEEVADNAWLGLLVRSQRAARAAGGDLRLATTQRRLIALLGRSGLLDLFDVYPTPERATASFD